MPNFRYTKGKTYHPSEGLYSDIKGLKIQGTSENTLLAGNLSYFAVPIQGAGGRLGIIPLNMAGTRIQSNYPLILENGSEIVEFAFDPFDRNSLITACEDGKIRGWNISIDSGKTTQTNKDPSFVFQAHENKVSSVAFHPSIKGLLLTVSIERAPDIMPSVKLWKRGSKWELFKIFEHNDVVTSACFHPCGRFLATSSKDKLIRIYDLSQGAIAIEGKAHESVRGSRLVWLSNSPDQPRLASIGFGTASQREIKVFDLNTLDKSLPQASLSKLLDTSPAILVPHFDIDTGVLFLYGRGDTAIKLFQIEDKSITAIDPFARPNPHFDLVFMPKKACNIKGIEFAACYRLHSTDTGMHGSGGTMTNAIEKIGFSVPRQRPEFFQDDIFVPHWDNETAVLDVEKWSPAEDEVKIWKGIESLKKTLMPSGMTALSEAPILENKSKVNLEQQRAIADEETKRKEVLDNLFKMAKSQEGELVSSHVESELNAGVESDEWDT